MDAPQPQAWRVRCLAQLGQGTHAFSHAGGGIQSPFTGNHQVCPRNPLIEFCSGSKIVKAGLGDPTEKGHQSVTEPSGGPSSRLVTIGCLQHTIHDHRKAFKAGLRRCHVLAPEAFLRAINPGSPFRAQKWIVHIRSNDQFLKGVGVLWRDHGLESVQGGPFFKSLVLLVSKLPSQSSCQSEPSIIGGASSNTYHAGSSPFLSRLLNQSTQSESIQIKGVTFPGKQSSQSNDSRRFDNGHLLRFLPPPASADGSA